MIEQRIDFEVAPEAEKPMLALERYLASCGLERSLLELVKFRVSMMNGCAYCLDMHWKDARARDESEQRLYGLGAWREAPYYSERERAAFAWAEAVTRPDIGRVPDDVYQAARRHFDEKQLAGIVLWIATTNFFNRINVTVRQPAGQEDWS